MIPSHYIGPYIISNLLGLFLILVAIKWPRIAKALFVTLFLGSGLVNMYLALTNPRLYVTGFGPLAVLGIYRTFIYGFFRSHTGLIVLFISLGQLCVAGLLALEDRLLLVGFMGSVLFLVAIAPLGVGSAFPSSILMAIGAVLMYRNVNRPLADYTKQRIRRPG
jgi:hypothetical protein